MNQKGFATLEVILMVVVIGILATIAVPRFTDVTTRANTAKIQADLSTIDSAISIYYMEKGVYPTTSSDIDIDTLVSNGYLNDVTTPPKGSAFVKGVSTEISSIASSGKYKIGKPGTGSNAADKEAIRGKLGDYVVSDFYKN